MDSGLSASISPYSRLEEPSDRERSCSTTSSISQTSQHIPREVCDAVFLQLHGQLRRDLNFHEIWPYLNSYQLLSATNQVGFIDPRNTPETKVDILVSNLPHYPHDDYLSPFLSCLKESSKRPGVEEAHEQLAGEIHRLYKIEIKKYRKRKKDLTRSSVQELTETSRDCAANGITNSDETKPKHFSAYKRYWCIIAGIIAAVLMTVLFLISLILFLKVLPESFQHPASYPVFGSGTITLDEDIDNWLIESVDMQFHPSTKDQVCTGHVGVIPGSSCVNSHNFIQTTVEELNSDNLAHYQVPFYATTGFIKIYIPDSDDVRNQTIIFTQTLKDYNTLKQLDTPTRQCENIPPRCINGSCYRTNDHINKTVMFNIYKPGFYFFLLTGMDDSCLIPPLSRVGGIQYFINISTFNYDAIMEYNEQHSIKLVDIAGNESPETIRVSRHFKFGETSCNLLHFDCLTNVDNDLPTFDIIGSKPRRDIAYMILILYTVCLFLDVVVVILWYCVRKFVQKH